MLRLLDLRFLPASVDLALFVLRLWFGFSLVYLHGWAKLVGYPENMHRFADPFGIGAPASLALAVFGEVVCASLLAAGLFTRFAALGCAINMSVAFVYSHGARLSGQGNGELAFMYLGAFIALLLAGPGRYALDARRGVRY